MNYQAPWEKLKSDYSSAKSSRFRRKRTGINLYGSNADYHYRSESDFLKIMEYARDMDRNDAIIGSTINANVRNTIQGGFSLDCTTSDQGLNNELWAAFDEWASTPSLCDAAGEMTFFEKQELAFRHVLVDGDIVSVGSEDGYVQDFEAHRVRTPRNSIRNVVNGVLLDDRRQRIEYWVTKEDVSTSSYVDKVSDIFKIPVKNDYGIKQVFHTYNPKRITQTRGVSALSPIFDCAGMFEDINFAKMVQQQVVSCFAIFRTRSVNAPAPPTSFKHGEVTSTTYVDGTAKKEVGIQPGMEYTAAPGEDLKGFSPAVPNAEFFDHVKLILTLIGVNLGMPLVMVLMDAKETNFSGWRGAVEQAREGFRANQRMMIRRYNSPVYVWKVNQLIHNGKIKIPKSVKNPFLHRWQPSAWNYIDPFKDTASDISTIKSVLSSPRRVHAKRGCDWQDIASETIEDNSYAILKAIDEAKRINSRHPESNVHWRELLSLPVPDGLAAMMKISGEGQGKNES